MQKIIFLDIDGVLNSHQYLAKTEMEDAGFYKHIDPQKLKRLKTIVSRTNASVVLSSSWREMFDEMQPTEPAARQLFEALQAYGLVIEDMTPMLKGNKAEEIREWLACHKSVKQYVILDDDHYDWNELLPHWVKTSYYIGLSEKDVQEAIAILNQ